jgi:hypothetical protein
MRKNVALLFSLALAVLLTLSTMRPANASIVTAPKWLQPTFSGSDSFYGAAVVAYEEGSTAMLGVTVDRSGAPTAQVNITAISVIFDWGGNYTLVLAPPFVLDDTVTQAAFIVTFTVPSTAVASNLFLHTYRVNVKYVTSVGPNMFATGTLGSFAVYSMAQADAQALRQTANAYTEPSGGFSSNEARILWARGNSEVSRGNTAYTLGNFDGAKTYYQNAIDYFGQAYAAETAYSQDYRDAQTNANNAQANYYNALASAASKQADAAVVDADAHAVEADAAATEADAALRQADAALTNAYGWMAFGIGWILIGVGAIVYGLRRPKAPA